MAKHEFDPGTKYKKKSGCFFSMLALSVGLVVAGASIITAVVVGISYVV